MTGFVSLCCFRTATVRSSILSLCHNSVIHLLLLSISQCAQGGHVHGLLFGVLALLKQSTVKLHSIACLQTAIPVSIAKASGLLWCGTAPCPWGPSKP